MLKTYKIKVANYDIKQFITNDLIDNFMFITSCIFVINKRNN